MNPSHLAGLAFRFGLGTVVSCKRIAEGVLNDNYLLKTTAANYFIKQVRAKRVPDVPYIAAVESLMASREIPAICMLRDRDGNPSVAFEDKTYTLYPYVASDRSHAYIEADYERMGALLARIHEVGSHDIPPFLQSRAFARADGDLARSSLEGYARELRGQPQNKTDRDFLAYIDLKLSLMNTPKAPELPNVTLGHGDYHAGNLLIDKKTRAIVGVCDWEKAEMTPRAYEVARSTLYTCFDGAIAEEKAVRFSRAFLRGYQRSNPLDESELRAGFAMRFERSVRSNWIEAAYYDRGDSRSNKFIASEMRTLERFVRGDLLEKILS
jgi:homoserine kinase type II